MLVLTRKIGERLVIGDGIEVMVVEIRGNKARLGIIAPKDLSIMRADPPKPPNNLDSFEKTARS